MKYTDEFLECVSEEDVKACRFALGVAFHWAHSPQEFRAWNSVDDALLEILDEKKKSQFTDA